MLLLSYKKSTIQYVNIWNIFFFGEPYEAIHFIAEDLRRMASLIQHCNIFRLELFKLQFFLDKQKATRCIDRK